MATCRLGVIGMFLTAGAYGASGASLDMVRPSGGDPPPASNPPVVEALIEGALVRDSVVSILIDGIHADLLPEADGIDNDGDAMVDEEGERLVSWPGSSVSRLCARWPWSVTADDPTTAAHEGVHTLVVTIGLATGDTLVHNGCFAVFATSRVDSLIVFPSPFDPWEEGARIGYRTFTPGDVRIQVFDFQGRIVAMVQDWHREEPGWHEGSATWDGTDQEGARAGNGVYFIRVEFDDGSLIQDRVEPCLVAH